MDAAIGEVLNLLDEQRLTENTIVIFFSDNGGSGGADNTPLRGGKGQMFEGGIRVCCLARFPGRIRAGSVNDQFVTSMDVLPTLVKLAGAKTPDGVIVDGHDIMPVLAEGKPSPRKDMFWKRQGDEAARAGNWKWIRNQSGTFLFDLSQDMGEKNNLIDRMPERAAEMEARFAAWLKTMEEAEPREPFRDF